MSKKSKAKKAIQYIEAPHIEQTITQTLETNYMPYAMSVILSRAIPEIDGFKPAHRKLLYTMHGMGLMTKNRSKSADVVGTTMRLNPHGEGAIYETLVRLTRGNEALLHPFVDSKGNFGKAYSRDMAYAASRYTEVKLAGICEEIFKDIDKNTVDFVDNYNGTLKEPTLLPTSFPNLLVTPNLGIAVGMASSICSFNLEEVCNGVIAMLEAKNDEGINLVDIIKAPDFSTGGELLYNRDEIEKIYETGRGSFKLRAIWSFDAANNCIEISQIPYTTTIEAIIDKIYLLVKSGRIKEITDVRDETDLKGLKIAIDIRRGVDAANLMDKLFVATPLMDSFSCNFNLAIDGRPQTLGVYDILKKWIAFRKGAIARGIAFDLEKNKQRLHLLEGLAKIILDIDRAIAIIRETEKAKDVVSNLCKGFDITTIQAEYVAEIRLRNINKEYLMKQIKDKDALIADIDKLNATLDDEKKIEKIIIKEQKEIIKKYGQERKTAIIEGAAPAGLKLDVFVEDYPLQLYLTRENYFKKIANSSLKTNPEIAVKEGDVLIQQIAGQNVDDVIFFTNKQNAYKMKANDITDNKPSQMGAYLPNLLKCDEDEVVSFIAATSGYDGHLLFVFESGKGVLIPLASYKTQTNRKRLVNAMSSKTPLVFAKHLMGHEDFVVHTEGKRGARRSFTLNTELLTVSSTKSAEGVFITRE
ncbi:MAG: topoisomerase IV, partial [Defluviitaleaceae bacterium]|nr:topoisomerase IV [Defluviitaleaceae bacterium]